MSPLHLKDGMERRAYIKEPKKKKRGLQEEKRFCFPKNKEKRRKSSDLEKNESS